MLNGPEPLGAVFDPRATRERRLHMFVRPSLAVVEFDVQH
jgi:hypothetical protein